mgnify:CR=1 FL=1
MATYKVSFKWVLRGNSGVIEVEAAGPEEAIAQAFEDWSGEMQSSTAINRMVKVESMSCDDEAVIPPAGWAAKPASTGGLDMSIPDLAPLPESPQKT